MLRSLSVKQVIAYVSRKVTSLSAPFSFATHQHAHNSVGHTYLSLLVPVKRHRGEPERVRVLSGTRVHATRLKMAAVGLGSVPLWRQPHAALSTGEAFRSELACWLQWAAANGQPLALDAFCDHLDALSACMLRRLALASLAP